MRPFQPAGKLGTGRAEHERREGGDPKRRSLEAVHASSFPGGIVSPAVGRAFPTPGYEESAGKGYTRLPTRRSAAARCSAIDRTLKPMKLPNSGIEHRAAADRRVGSRV